MADSKNLIIQKAIQTLLSTEIRKTNGYHFDLTKVSRKYLDIAKMSVFPAASIIRGGRAIAIGSEDEALKEVKASFAVIGYLHIDDDSTDVGKLNDMADQFEQDVIDCIEKNIQTLWDSTELDVLTCVATDPILDDTNNVGTISVLIQAEYTYDQTT